MQSVPTTTKVVSSNPTYGEVYSIQHYVIKFVSDLRQLGGFLRVLWFPPPTRQPRYSWNIVESGIKHHNPSPISLFWLHVYTCLILYRHNIGKAVLNRKYLDLSWLKNAGMSAFKFKQNLHYYDSIFLFDFSQW